MTGDAHLENQRELAALDEVKVGDRARLVVDPADRLCALRDSRTGRVGTIVEVDCDCLYGWFDAVLKLDGSGPMDVGMYVMADEIEVLP